MTLAESLRAYASWCEANPSLQREANITTYGETVEQAKGIILSDPQAKFDLSSISDIVYLVQNFGSLTVKHVLTKSKVCDLSITDNKAVAVLKPEFAELVTP